MINIRYSLWQHQFLSCLQGWLYWSVVVWNIQVAGLTDWVPGGDMSWRVTTVTTTISFMQTFIKLSIWLSELTEHRSPVSAKLVCCQFKILFPILEISHYLSSWGGFAFYVVTVVAKVAGSILDTVLYTTLVIILTNDRKNNKRHSQCHLSSGGKFCQISSGIDCLVGQVVVVAVVRWGLPGLYECWLSSIAHLVTLSQPSVLPTHSLPTDIFKVDTPTLLYSVL